MPGLGGGSSNAAAALAAHEVRRTEPEHVERLNRNAERMRTGFRQLGFDIGNSTTPVIPIILGDDQLVLIAWRMLLENGVYVNAILAQATLPGRQLLRTSYMATHTDDQLDRVLDVFERIGKDLSII